MLQASELLVVFLTKASGFLLLCSQHLEVGIYLSSEAGFQQSLWRWKGQRRCLSIIHPSPNNDFGFTL